MQVPVIALKKRIISTVGTIDEYKVGPKTIDAGTKKKVIMILKTFSDLLCFFSNNFIEKKYKITYKKNNLFYF